MKRLPALLVLSVFLLASGAGGKDAWPSPEPCAAPPAGMACVPGGPFPRGTDDGPKDTRPRSTVFVGTFYMDLLETTFAEYKRCVAAGRCRDAGPSYSDFDRPRQPITGVSWYDAVGYCAAQGKHLPTEAEWEKAARGPEGRLYPWGNEPATCKRAVFRDRHGRSCGVPKVGQRPDLGRPFEVGQKPPGIFGLYDMAGNSWEWVYDWYSQSYGACGNACLGVDPRGPCQGAEKCPGFRRRVVRGGSWYWGPEMATGFYRRAHVPGNDPFHHFGFRCAASVEEARALAK